MRQILRTFTSLSLRTKPLQFRYATETKNVFVLPKKQMIHPAAINDVMSTIDESYTVRMLSYLFRVKFLLLKG